jgi:hypothetical protein
VKQKLFFLLFRLASIILLALPLWLSHTVAQAEGIEVVQAHLEKNSEGYRLSSEFEFDLNRGLEDAISRGIPLYFTTEVDVTRPRWYWFDVKAIKQTQTIRISYNVLTRQYHAAIGGNLQLRFNTLQDALSLVRRPNRWLIGDTDALTEGQTYNVSLRMQLDVAQLPKPFQVHALNSSDWHLSSDWVHFTYTPEPQ